MVLPLSPEKFIIQDELGKDSTLSVQGPDSILFININDQLDSRELTTDDLQVPGQTTFKTLKIDTLQLASTDPFSSGEISVGELFPDMSNHVGEAYPIQEFTIEPAPKILSPGDFQNLRVVEGNLLMTFTNDLPFEIGPNAQTPGGMEIRILNNDQNTVVCSVEVPEVIKPGERKTVKAPLGEDSQWIYSPLRLEYTLPIAKDTTVQITGDMQTNSNCQFDFSIENAKVTEATAKLDPQTFDYYWNAELDNDNRVEEGEVESGNITIEFENQCQVGGTINIQVPNVIAADGRSYEDNIQIGPESNLVQKIDLAGYKVINADDPGMPVDSIPVRMEVKTDQTDQFVHVSINDKIETRTVVSDISFRQFDGYLAEGTLDIDPFEEQEIADYKNLSSGFQFEGAELEIEVTNEISIENLMLSLNLNGYHRDKNGNITDSARIVIQNEQILSGTPESPQKTVIQLQGEQINNFLNILPTDILGNGAVVYSGQASVRAGAAIHAAYHFSTPMKFKIVNPQPIQADVDTLTDDDISQDFRDGAGDDFQTAVLTAIVLNHSPVSGSVRLIVSADSNHQDIYDAHDSGDTRLEFQKEIQVGPASIDPATGKVSASGESTVSLNLTREELSLFQQTPLRIGYELNLNETGGTVVLCGSDFIQIAGKIEINVLVKDE